ncbi:GGDEF domain-containing protein [Sphingomonas quercus]|uniref:diguanylate cyclase n=1 Tax=Sphingomonas quercus TaxID=2842451 RepID=A0ABS6BLS9_9SPHN|nr:GGDEF domain-containing protein [Sphingomonas quercus]
MSHIGDVMERIASLMSAGEIPPTPANYEFWYRYVTGADPELVEAIDAIMRTAGRVSPRAMDNVRRELYGGGGRGTLNRLLDDARRQLEALENFVGRTEASTRDYRVALDDGQQVLASSVTLEKQRAMLAEMVRATNAMMQKTKRLEKDLANSSHQIDRLKADLEIARSESRTDPLTGLANRKACIDYLDAQILRARVEMRCLAAVFLDIDHFKHFNDSFGHRMGDEVLRLVAQSLERFCHGVGFPARWGGEEFIVVVPGRSIAEVAELAERFRAFIASRTVRAKQSHRDVGRITVSLGVAQLNLDETAQDLVDRADAMLYEAKTGGRNRVAVAWPAGQEQAAA